MVDCVCELLEQVQSWQTVVDELVVFLCEVIAESESHLRIALELLLRCATLGVHSTTELFTLK
jgi:hypothetical protein